MLSLLKYSCWSCGAAAPESQVELDDAEMKRVLLVWMAADKVSVVDGNEPLFPFCSGVWVCTFLCIISSFCNYPVKCLLPLLVRVSRRRRSAPSSGLDTLLRGRLLQIWRQAKGRGRQPPEKKQNCKHSGRQITSHHQQQHQQHHLPLHLSLSLSLSHTKIFSPSHTGAQWHLVRQ